ncbi:MAG: hypothetical protein IK954_02430 [Clostridia bacterium]|nr:hypothetical protein [Clostridia bacterium]
MKQVVCCRVCGKRFWPRVSGQQRCYECIMASPPPVPSAECKKDSTEFVEWFIYKWNIIRMLAHVPQEPEQPVIQPKKRKYRRREVSIRKMALDKGILPATVYNRLRKGWTLEEALEEKQ